MSSSQSLNITELLGFRLPSAAIVAVFTAMGWVCRQMRDLTNVDRRQAVEAAARTETWVTSYGGLRPCVACAQFAGSAAIDVMTVRRQQFPPGIYFREFPVRIAMMFLVRRLPQRSTRCMVRAGRGLDLT